MLVFIGLTKLDIFNRKEKGSADSILFSLIAVFIAVILMIVFIPSLKIVYMNGSIEGIKREYILRMEIDGGLTHAKSLELQEAIKTISKTDIIEVTVNTRSFDPLHESPAEYGEQIVLDFNVTFNIMTYDFKSLFDSSTSNKNVVKNYKAASTSKK